jgi:RNA polymerase sigma-70 factor (ECF subfamily)
VIRWLNKDHNERSKAIGPREPDRATARCILDCSINLKSTTGDSGARKAPEKQPRPAPPMNTVAKPDTPPLDDETLVAKTLKGDKEAYRLLVERYQNRLLAMASDILKSREDAEDVVQESFVKAFLSLGKFKGDSSFYTWLYRIAYNMAIDVRRKAGRRGGNHVEYKEGAGVNKVASSSGEGAETVTGSAEHLQNVEGPHAALVRKETGRRLQEVLRELSEEHRAVIMLREVDGLNYDEIAHAVGVPRGTVMSRLHYARKALQQALQEFAVPMESDKKEENEDQEIPLSTTKAVKSSLR